METPFSRLNSRLRGIGQVAIQVAQGELTDIKVMSRHPVEIRQVTQQLRESARLLDEMATEAEVSLSHRQENAEAYAALASSANNAATVVGTDGQNIKIIIFSDPAFVFEVLTEGSPETLEQVFRKLEPALKKKIAKWIK